MSPGDGYSRNLFRGPQPIWRTPPSRGLSSLLAKTRETENSFVPRLATPPPMAPPLLPVPAEMLAFRASAVSEFLMPTRLKKGPGEAPFAFSPEYESRESP